MKKYRENELILKSRYDLANIAIENNLIPRYKINDDRNELIKLILSRNEYRVLKRILEYDEESMYKLQMFFQNNIKFLELNGRASINQVLKLYVDIDTTDFIINIDEKLNIGLDAVLIIDEFRYIHAIGYLEQVGVNKYRLTVPKMMSSISKDIKLNRLFLALLEEGSDYNLYNYYYNNTKENLINTSIYLYILEVQNYEILEAKINNVSLNIELGIDYFNSIYSKELFYINTVRLKPTKIFLFGQKAKDVVESNKFVEHSSKFSDIVYFLNNLDGKVKIRDYFGNVEEVKILELWEAFVNYYKKEIENNQKIKIDKINILSMERFDNKLKWINLHYSENIKNADKYLLISSDIDNFCISDTSIKILDNKVIKNIQINSDVKIFNKQLSEYSFLKNIYKYIKIGICNLEMKSLFDYDTSFIEYLKNNLENDIEASIRKKEIDSEKNIKTRYSVYEDNLDEFNNAKRNNEYIFNLAKRVMDFYFNNQTLEKFYLKNVYSDIDISLENVEIYKTHLDEILKYISYPVVEKFFKNYDLMDILKRFSSIKIYGRLVRNSAFIDLLKEYIPGKFISSLGSSKSGIDILKSLATYEEDRKKGYRNIEFVYNHLDYEIVVCYTDYKGNKIELINRQNTNAYFDKSINSDIVEIEIHKKYIYETPVVTICYIDPKREYVEMDENEIIQNDSYSFMKEYMNDISNGIYRIFLNLADNVIHITILKRIDNQMYIFTDVNNDFHIS